MRFIKHLNDRCLLYFFNFGQLQLLFEGKKNSLLNRESTWIYRYTLTKSDLDPMGINSLGKGVTAAANTAASMIGQANANLTSDKPQCFHYVLTFNPSKVLKNWAREACTSTSLCLRPPN